MEALDGRHKLYGRINPAECTKIMEQNFWASYEAGKSRGNYERQDQNGIKQPSES